MLGTTTNSPQNGKKNRTRSLGTVAASLPSCTRNTPRCSMTAMASQRRLPNTLPSPPRAPESPICMPPASLLLLPILGGSSCTLSILFNRRFSKEPLLFSYGFYISMQWEGHIWSSTVTSWVKYRYTEFVKEVRRVSGRVLLRLCNLGGQGGRSQAMEYQL